MPHETITNAASGTTMAATKRRNIRLPELYTIDARKTMCEAIEKQFIT
jgi:hypothetical protein